MSFILNLLLFIFILGVIVFVHEFGHFIFAKMNGVYVYEFAIGMGPKLFSKKGKETEYTLRLIPIGGFCSLAGEEVDQNDITVPKGRRLQDKKAWQRFLIMFFGAGNNFISAILILFFIALVWGGTDMIPRVSEVQKNSAAAIAGLEKGDIIKKINNQKVDTIDDISLYFAVSSPNKKSTIEVEKKNGYVKTYDIKPKKKKVNGKTSYVYGIGLKQKRVRGFASSITYTFKKTKSIFKQMRLTVTYLFTGKVRLSQMSGPVGIYSLVGEQSKQGLAQILYLVAFLSINVGFINLLPLPAFDGGHILFILIELIKRKPVDPKVENTIHSIGMFLLMALMLYVTINDIFKLF